MTRKLLILFVVLTLCFFSLISSLLGERGIIVNNELKRQLKENEYELDKGNVELENLRMQQKELATEDGLRSAAINLGYQVESDDVYVFSSEGEAKPSVTVRTEQAATSEKSGFRPWSLGFCLLISFCASFIITLLFWLFRRNKEGNTDDSEQEESGNTGDNLSFD